MTDWIVVLRTSEGTQLVPVTADLVEESEDKTRLTFTNVGPMDEVIAAFYSIREDTPADDAKAALWKLLRAGGRIKVASFKLESVDGYYQDTGSESKTT